MASDVAFIIIGVMALVIVALILALFFVARQSGNNVPPGQIEQMQQNAKEALGAVAALAMFASLNSANKIDDALVNTLMLPVFKMLGIPIPTLPGATPEPPAGGAAG